MEAFNTLTAVAAILDRPNVDTDLIIPKQFLKRIERSGFGRFVFYELRFLPDGTPDPDSVFNQPRYKEAKILVSRENFGCGSSREHAPWALADYGFRVIISPSFGDIFRNNSFKNGMLLIELSISETAELIKLIAETPGYSLTVDLAAQKVSGENFTATFQIDPFRKELLLNGWDEISLTLQKDDLITNYEKSHAQAWQAASIQTS